MPLRICTSTLHFPKTPFRNVKETERFENYKLTLVSMDSISAVLVISKYRRCPLKILETVKILLFAVL